MNIRRRWAAFRETQNLAFVSDPDFGRGGIARHAEGVRVRLMILPRDPLAIAVEFEDDEWEWWQSEWPNPFPGAGQTDGGHEVTPTAEAAVRFTRLVDGKWQWDTYLALHRSGSLEAGLGSLGSRSWRPEGADSAVEVFFLTQIVGRVWWALSRYGDVINRLGLEGPWEISLALRGTMDSVLGNVASGWAEPFSWDSHNPPTCPDPNVLIVRECDEWPDAEGVERLAMTIGGLIEDAWGSRQRRFLARIDPDLGKFDVSRYR